jgi:hypothetical protein
MACAGFMPSAWFTSSTPSRIKTALPSPPCAPPSGRRLNSRTDHRPPARPCTSGGVRHRRSRRRQRRLRPQHPAHRAPRRSPAVRQALSGDILVVRWVDRLGRNYEDVCGTIRHFMRRGVVIRTVINNFTFDGATKDPMRQAVRDALIAFMAATAQATGRGHQGRSASRHRAREAAG